MLNMAILIGLDFVAECGMCTYGLITDTEIVGRGEDTLPI